MEKVVYVTRDIFNDAKTVEKYWTPCVRAAWKSGLRVFKCEVDGMQALRMYGTKWNFMQYYTRTMFFDTKPPIGVIKRLGEVIRWNSKEGA